LILKERFKNRDLISWAMITQLTELIKKHERNLRVEDWKKIPYENLRDFEAELIKTKNYTYGVKEMEELHSFLESKKFSIYSRYNALEMVIRRKIMDDIKDIDKRKGLWMAIDCGLSQDHRTDMVLLYAARYGIEETEKDLKKMTEAYEKKIRPSSERLKKKLNKEKDPEKKKVLEEVYENHMQLPSSVIPLTIPYLLSGLENIREKHKSEAMQ
jgi:hypothetical protein